MKMDKGLGLVGGVVRVLRITLTGLEGPLPTCVHRGALRARQGHPGCPRELQPLSEGVCGARSMPQQLQAEEERGDVNLPRY